MEITLRRSLLTLMAVDRTGLGHSHHIASSRGTRSSNASDQSAVVAAGAGNDYGWVSEGWWVIEASNCMEIIKGDLNSRYYYIYREGLGDEVWQAKKSLGWRSCIGCH